MSKVRQCSALFMAVVLTTLVLLFVPATAQKAAGVPPANPSASPTALPYALTAAGEAALADQKFAGVTYSFAYEAGRQAAVAAVAAAVQLVTQQVMILDVFSSLR